MRIPKLGRNPMGIRGEVVPKQGAGGRVLAAGEQEGGVHEGHIVRIKHDDLGESAVHQSADF